MALDDLDKFIKPTLIQVQFEGQMCASCDEPIRHGSRAWWVRGAAIWHEDCEQPRSLITYLREAKERRKSGPRYNF
jgi:hypothetical protein